MTAITQDIEQHSINVCKALMLDTVRKANSGHSGGPLSALDFTYVLYKDIMDFNPPFNQKYFLFLSSLKINLPETLCPKLFK